MKVRSRAPGKLILFGEHSVVYGRPAIAIPIHSLFAEAVITAGKKGSGITIHATDLSQTISSLEATDHPLILTVRQVFHWTHLPEQDIDILITSSIPMASGLGSGAAVSAAIVQALAAFLDCKLTPVNVSDIVYETEKIHHGTPSGIDNTVIALASPIFFVRGESPKPVEINGQHQLVIGDTGIPVPTHIPVGQVREGWQADRNRYEGLFDDIAAIVEQAVRALASNDATSLGPLMTANHAALGEMGVSSSELDRLVEAAIDAGALGAKLSGAGQGGNMIALVTDETSKPVAESLKSSGASAVYTTWIE